MAEILEGFGGTAEQASKAVALLKSLSHEGRLQILCCLVDGERSVTQLAEALKVALGKLGHGLNQPQYNLIVQTAPLRAGPGSVRGRAARSADAGRSATRREAAGVAGPHAQGPR